MRNKYCISEFISTLYALLLTKIFYGNARLIRRPLYLRGRKSLEYGQGLTIGHGCRFDLSGRGKTLIIGEYCEMGDYNHIVAHQRVEIGSNVLMASKIYISDTNHGNYKGEDQDSPLVKPNERKLITAPVRVGDNVWIGENVVILAGSNIGHGSIIGANAVVKGDVPENSIVAGIPAKPLKTYNFSTMAWESTEND